LPHAELVVYEGAPHGIPYSHTEQVNRDLLAFLAG
jgi:non-heme chloroperoxidase